MRVDDFDFHLPEDRIAQYPAEPADAARLLEVRPDGFGDYGVRDLPSLLAPGDLLVFNEDERLGMERRAHERGHQMRWQNSAWQLLQYIEFVRQKREISTGRGVRFERQGPSIYADRNEELVAPPPRVPEEVPPRED